MKKQSKKFTLCRKSSHRKALKRNLLTSLILNGHVQTTLIKAKCLKHEFDSFISQIKKSKTDDNSKQIYANSILYTKEATEKLFKDVLPLCENRTGGYTSMYKTKERLNDGATLAKVEILNYVQNKDVK